MILSEKKTLAILVNMTPTLIRNSWVRFIQFFVSVAPIVVFLDEGSGWDGGYGGSNQGVADPELLALGEDEQYK